MALNPDQFYPTIFHQGIDVTAAQTEAVFYEEQYADLNYTRLRVTVGYTGSDPQLAGWSSTGFWNSRRTVHGCFRAVKGKRTL